MPAKMIRNFFKLEASAGIILCLAAILALLCENSFLKLTYDAFLTTRVSFQFGDFILDKPFLLWINDGLMAIFFLLVGLEIKREILEGQLSNRKQITLPVIATLGSIAIPSLIYTIANLDDLLALRGWAIPAATDIAFALGILMLLGKRVHENLKICLLAIAIIGDLAIIFIIALFYTKNLSFFSIGFSLIAILGLLLLNLRGVSKISPYIVIGFILWVSVLQSGVHTTLAGVILAAFIPLNAKNGKKPLRSLEQGLHPWIAYAVLPLFAFANAGVSFQGVTLSVLMQPISLGIAAGLFFGTQIGIMLFTYFGVLMKLCKLPDEVNWCQYYGMACITGVGFTMSLFIGTLAFDDYSHQTSVRLGVLLGSIPSAVLGYCILRINPRKDFKKTS